ERRTRGVWLALVVAGDDPHLAGDLDAHLRRTQHMTRRMQRHIGFAQAEALAVGMAGVVLVAKPPLQDRQPVTGRVITTHARSRVVAMPVRDDGCRYRTQGVDMEIALR